MGFLIGAARRGWLQRCTKLCELQAHLCCLAVCINGCLLYPAPAADFIKIAPGECYCYSFTLPEDHPDGTFWVGSPPPDHVLRCLGCCLPPSC